MRKYRIIKKTNFDYRHKAFDEVFIVQVKYSLLWNNIKWWDGTDINDVDWGRHYKYSNMNGFPHPYHETDEKYPGTAQGATGSTLFFLSFDAAMFFIERAKAQDEFMNNVDSLMKHKKATEEVVYVDGEDNIQKRTKETCEDTPVKEKNENKLQHIIML